MTTALLESAMSWRGLAAAQQPVWPDSDRLEAVRRELASRHPLVSVRESERLRKRLAAVCRREAFMLQGGDCAEDFGAPDALVQARLQQMLMMSLVLMHGGQIPTVRIGRTAGQYPKPRTNETETRGGVTLPVFRGVSVNGPEFTAEARTPNPERLLWAYNDSASTLNFIRTLMADGFASLRQVHTWIAKFVRASPVGQQYEQLARDIDRALAFMAASGTNPDENVLLHAAEFYISHETLVLAGAESMLRIDPDTDGIYDLSAHFHWIGDRTRQVDGAHVAFVAATRGPVGLKVGPSITVEELLELCRILNPDNLEGRLTLIVRMGADKIDQLLPSLIRVVQTAGHKVVWQCDPMHGNPSKHLGIKTRRFDQIVMEVERFFAICRAEGAWPGGLHLEMTADNVTECVEGNLVPEGYLTVRYETLCDPRLNSQQALALAFRVAELLQQSA